MIPLDKFKESLGSLANTLPETQVEQFRVLLDQVADAAFDKWLNRRSAERLPQSENMA